MKTRLILLPLALIAASAVRADDSRIGTLLFDPARIVSISGQIGFQSTIEFAADERIENIAMGDSSAWQVTPNRRANLLFLKPVIANGRTNMTVVTSKRTYLFDLGPQSKGVALLYSLRFTYADPIVPLADEEAGPKAAVNEPGPVIADIPLPLKLNFAWTGKGHKALLPQRSFDDGKALYLAWDKDVELPAILVPGPDKSEGPVNYTTQGDYIVVEGVPERIILRVGKLEAILSSAHVVVAPAALAEAGKQ